MSNIKTWTNISVCRNLNTILRRQMVIYKPKKKDELDFSQKLVLTIKDKQNLFHELKL